MLRFGKTGIFASLKGVPKDEVEAVKLLRSAAEQGFADAQAEYAQMLLYGFGMASNPAEAVKLYGLAAKQKNAKAMCEIAGMCEKGRYGFTQSRENAILWYNRAIKAEPDSIVAMSAKSQLKDFGIEYNASDDLGINKMFDSSESESSLNLPLGTAKIDLDASKNPPLRLKSQ